MLYDYVRGISIRTITSHDFGGRSRNGYLRVLFRAYILDCNYSAVFVRSNIASMWVAVSMVRFNVCRSVEDGWHYDPTHLFKH